MELEVQKYLRAGNSLEDLNKCYGIKSRAHSDYSKLIGLKYDQIDSSNNRNAKIVRECRGLILDSTLNTWKVVAYPFNRFFNFGEGFCDKIDWETAYVQEKIDGSIAIFYYFGGKWNVGTSGTPDASGNVSGALSTVYTYKDLFWETLNKQIGYNYIQTCLNKLPKNITFIFELCAPENKIVVRHSDRKLVLLGARDINSFKEYRPGEMIHYFPNTECPRIFAINGVKDALETLVNMDGLKQEGFVVVDDKFNRMKMKCGSYIAIHHLASDILSYRKVFQGILFKDEISETIAILPEYESVLLEAEDKFIKLIKQLEKEYEEACLKIENTVYPNNKKEFAMAVKNSVCSSALFSLRSGETSSIKEFLINHLNIDGLLKILGYKN